MKKFLLLVLITGSFGLNAQVFQARDFVLSLVHAGVAAAEFTASDSAGYKTEHEEAGFNFAIRGEYGLSNWLSVNFSMSLSPLLVGTLFDQGASCYIYDVGPGLGYHVPWKNQWIDLEGDIGLGYTRFLRMDFGEKLDVKAVSVFGDFHPRVYFTKKKRLGGFLYYRFNLYSGSGELSRTGLGTRNLDIQGYTHAFGIGWFYRFGNRIQGTPPFKPTE